MFLTLIICLSDGKPNEEDNAASDSTTFYDIAEIGITTSRCKNSVDVDHHDAESKWSWSGWFCNEMNAV